MTTHTPGPWEARLSDGRKTLCVQSEDGVWICGEFQADNETAIPSEEAWANARMCAAGTGLFALANHPVMEWILTDGIGYFPEPQRTSIRLFIIPLRDAVLRDAILGKATGAAS